MKWIIYLRKHKGYVQYIIFRYFMYKLEFVYKINIDNNRGTVYTLDYMHLGIWIFVTIKILWTW